jgi:hypothetical protein
LRAATVAIAFRVRSSLKEISDFLVCICQEENQTVPQFRHVNPNGLTSQDSLALLFAQLNHGCPLPKASYQAEKPAHKPGIP